MKFRLIGIGSNSKTLELPNIILLFPASGEAIKKDINIENLWLNYVRKMST
ncbi:hypothetical protein NSP_41250 [Nodularia spumigena CCY9414]|nr:hypothetical protein NSP_41250 [Nodularia spumigena CCY9414]